jgi:hypothetical protein
MTLFPSRVLVQEQVEKRKSAGFASMNRRLYEYARLKPIHGKIGTDYWILDRLPGLNQYHRHFEIPRPATPEFLESVRADPEVRYILTGEDAFPPPVLVWMSQRVQEYLRRAGLSVRRTSSALNAPQRRERLSIC